MAIQFGPPVQTKTSGELNDATTFLNNYKRLYYGNSGDVIGDNEVILCLIGYKNYLSALYGIGLTAPATGSSVTQSFTTGTSFQVTSGTNAVVFTPTGSVTGSFTFNLSATTGSSAAVTALSTIGYI